jgi:hypothetical protein
MIPVIVDTSDAYRPQGIFGGFPRRLRRIVPGVSAYA